jgi:hypothetical protein
VTKDPGLVRILRRPGCSEFPTECREGMVQEGWGIPSHLYNGLRHPTFRFQTAVIGYWFKQASTRHRIRSAAESVSL